MCVCTCVFYLSLSPLLQRPTSLPPPPSFLFLWLLHLLRVLAVRTLVTSSLMFNGPFLAKEERGTWNEGREAEEGTRNRAGQPERYFCSEYVIDVCAAAGLPRVSTNLSELVTPTLLQFNPPSSGWWRRGESLEIFEKESRTPYSIELGRSLGQTTWRRRTASIFEDARPKA